MFECKLRKAELLKKIIDAIKDLVSDAPFDCSETEIRLQSMDGSHVALVSLKLGIGLFDIYRCDRTINLGLSLKSVALALKCANNNDTCTLRFEDDESDNVMFSFENASKKKTQDITVKLMDIDAEQLGVPEQKYSAVIDMSAAEFKKTVSDLMLYSDTVLINAVKGQVTFAATGDMGGNVVKFESAEEVAERKQKKEVEKAKPKKKKKNKRVITEDDEEEEEEEEEANGADEEMEEDEEEESEEDNVNITVKEPVKVTFSVKYLNQFAKATNLSKRVRLSISNNVPIVVEYIIPDDGYLKFYLAPKIDDDADMD